MSIKHLRLIYASQGGTAMEVSERIQRECRSTSLDASVESIDEFDINDCRDDTVHLFIVSVAGQGSEPDSMTQFWKKLLKKLHQRLSILFSVFGLGDSSYLHYNFPSKKLQKRLSQLGGQAVCRLGLGDDQHPQGYEFGLDAWLEEVYAFLSESGVVFQEQSGIPPTSYTLSFTTHTLSFTPHTLSFTPHTLSFTTHTLSLTTCPHTYSHQSQSTPYKAAVIQNKRLTSLTHFQDVRSIKLYVDEQSAPFWYNAGDVLVLKPHNDPEEVQSFMTHLGYDAIADLPLTVTSNYSNSASHQFASTLRKILIENLDIFGQVKRYTFKLLSYFTTDPLHSQKLLDLSSTEHSDDFQSYVSKPRRTFFEIIQDFPSLVIPVEYLFDLVQGMKQRYFSIASACEEGGGVVELCVAVVGFKNVMKRRRVGVCTRYMAAWTLDQAVEFSVQKGTMDSVDTDRPVILIGPGTGIAPIRSFLQKRISKGMYNNYLFCGNRNILNDALYHSEFNQLQHDSKLRVWHAFSRDQDEKRYVQDLIREEGELVWRLIHDEDAVVYVSGSAGGMPTNIRAAFVALARERGGMSMSDAVAYFAEMDATKRYQKECWS